MKSLNEIKLALSVRREILFEKYSIKSMAIFGSYSRNEQNESSNLDLCVEFNGKISSRFIDLADEIEDYLGFRVDLVSKNGIKDWCFKSIENDLIYV